MEDRHFPLHLSTADVSPIGNLPRPDVPPGIAKRDEKTSRVAPSRGGKGLGETCPEWGCPTPKCIDPKPTVTFVPTNIAYRSTVLAKKIANYSFQ